MPEGPEVRIVAEQLAAELIGATLISVEIDTHSRYHKGGIPGYDSARLPARIVDITVKGKQILWIFDGGWYALSFLGMEGKWVWESRTHSNLWMTFTNRTIYYDDSMHYGGITFYDNLSNIQAKVDTIGPDLLAYALFLRGYVSLDPSEYITAERWHAAFRNPRLKNKEVGVFLLDQARFSGVGAYLCAELLYAVKVRPNRPLGALTDEEIRDMRMCILHMIFRAYAARGNTIKSYETPYGEKGAFECVVYGKKVCPQGHPVEKMKLKDGRNRHWVPAVQL